MPFWIRYKDQLAIKTTFSDPCGGPFSGTVGCVLKHVLNTRKSVFNVGRPNVHFDSSNLENITCQVRWSERFPLNKCDCSHDCHALMEHF